MLFKNTNWFNKFLNSLPLRLQAYIKMLDKETILSFIQLIAYLSIIVYIFIKAFK